MRILLAIDARQSAIDLKDPNLRKLKTNLEKKHIDYKYADPTQWHIPLSFVGDMGRERFALLEQRLRDLGETRGPFALKLDGIWAYPNQNEARLIWIGVQNSRELRALREDVLGQLEPSRLAPEDSGKPHLPLVRLRNHKNVSDLISPYKNTSFGTILVEKLVVYEMSSGGAFPIYKLLGEYPLGTGAELAPGAP